MQDITSGDWMLVTIKSWYPYAGLPGHWNHEDRENDELEVSFELRDNDSLAGPD